MKKTLIFIFLALALANVNAQTSVTVLNIPVSKPAKCNTSVNFLPMALGYVPWSFQLYEGDVTTHHKTYAFQMNQYHLFMLRYYSQFSCVKIGNVFGFDLVDCFNHDIIGTDVIEFSWGQKHKWTSQSISCGFFVDVFRTWTQDTSGNTIGWSNSTFTHASDFRSRSVSYGAILTYRFSCLEISTNFYKEKIICNVGFTIPIWLLFDLL